MKQKPKKDKQPIKTTIRFPPALHAQVRHRAIDEKTDMQALVVRAVEQYLKKGGSKS